MSEIKKIELEPVRISIEPKTRLLIIKQGNNEVKLTRDAVNGMKRLKEGKIEANVYTSQLLPRNRFTVSENGQISIVCKDEWEDSVVVIKRHSKKINDYERIINFVEKNKPYIAWDREFRGRY